MNLAALQAYIEGTPALMALLESGANRQIVTALNADHRTEATYDDVPAEAFVDIVAGETLSLEQEARVQTFLVSGGLVQLSMPGVQAWCFANLSPAAQTALEVGYARPKTVAEALGIAEVGEQVSHDHVRQVARESAASARAAYYAAEASKTAARVAALEAAGLAVATTLDNAEDKAGVTGGR